MLPLSISASQRPVVFLPSQICLPFLNGAAGNTRKSACRPQGSPYRDTRRIRIPFKLLLLDCITTEHLEASFLFYAFILPLGRHRNMRSVYLTSKCELLTFLTDYGIPVITVPG